MVHQYQLKTTQIIPNDTEFLPVPGYGDTYLVSKGGIVVNTKTVKAIGSKRRGYNVVGLINENGMRTFAVHRLVAQLFVENPENKPFVNHIDGNINNNDYTNLEWVTHKENMEHAKQNGLCYKNVYSKPDPNNSFEKGYNQIMMKDSKEFQIRLMKELGIKSRVSWLRRLRGRIEPRVSEKKIIDALFAEYGVTDVWGL